MTDDLPRPFGRYVLTRLIGEGGMAEVYQASVRVAEGLTKWVVIKKIRADFADDRDFTRMFVDEAKIALSLNPPTSSRCSTSGRSAGPSISRWS